MKKNKYNNGSSMPISGLSKDELKVAMKEWAEGSKTLEKLLWNCYNNGIETGGCHIKNRFAYIDIYGDSCSNEGKEKIKKWLVKFKNLTIHRFYYLQMEEIHLVDLIGIDQLLEWQLWREA